MRTHPETRHRKRGLSLSLSLFSTRLPGAGIPALKEEWEVYEIGMHKENTNERAWPTVVL